MSNIRIEKRRNRSRLLTASRLHFASPHFDTFVRWLEERKRHAGNDLRFHCPVWALDEMDALGGL